MAAEDYINWTDWGDDYSDYGDNFAEVGLCTVTKETPKAIFCVFDKGSRWVPRSQIRDVSLIGIDCISPKVSVEDGEKKGYLYVTRWLYNRFFI